MRVVDIMLAIPGFLMAIGIVALFGGGGLPPGDARHRDRERPDLRAIDARLDHRTTRRRLRSRGSCRSGCPNRRILGAHIIPNAVSPVIVAGTLALATSIIDAAGLGFLGLGPQDPATPEWGTMLTDTRRGTSQIAPFLAIFPGLAIVIVVMGFNLVGDGLREALDPKLRGRV